VLRTFLKVHSKGAHLSCNLERQHMVPQHTGTPARVVTIKLHSHVFGDMVRHQRFGGPHSLHLHFTLKM